MFKSLVRRNRLIQQNVFLQAVRENHDIAEDNAEIRKKLEKLNNNRFYRIPGPLTREEEERFEIEPGTAVGHRPIMGDSFDFSRLYYPGNSKKEHYNESFWDRIDSSFSGIQRYLMKRALRREQAVQTYDMRRVQIMGDDLSAAYFALSIGAGVKFMSQPGFLRQKDVNDLPQTYDPGYKVEALDFADSFFSIHYQGLACFSNLKHLRWLSFSNDQYFGNWHMDRLCTVAPDIEYLDISHCKRITHNAIPALYRLKYLHLLNVEGISRSLEFRLACLTVESETKDLYVYGIEIDKKNVKKKSAFSMN